MFKTKFTAFTMALLTAASFSGCGKSADTTTVVINSGSESTAEGNGHSNESLDLKLCASNAEAAMENKGYNFDDVSVEPPTDENNFFNIIIVAKDKPEEDSSYAAWCRECIELVNAEAVKQDPQYSPSSENYYGGIFDQYDVMITATCVDEILTNWAVFQTIEKGTHAPVEISNKGFDLSMFE